MKNTEAMNTKLAQAKATITRHANKQKADVLREELLSSLLDTLNKDEIAIGDFRIISATIAGMTNKTIIKWSHHSYPLMVNGAKASIR